MAKIWLRTRMLVDFAKRWNDSKSDFLKKGVNKVQ
jgi:hypothetical protein